MLYCLCLNSFITTVITNVTTAGFQTNYNIQQPKVHSLEWEYRFCDSLRLIPSFALMASDIDIKNQFPNSLIQIKHFT
jgi:hypothetical protein